MNKNEKGLDKVMKFIKSKEGILGIFSILFFITLCLTSNFNNDLYSYFKDVAYLLTAGLALMLVIMTGNIDISSGTVLGLVGFVAGNLCKNNVPILIVVIVAILVGMINSFIVGFITVRFKVPSMVVSLAMVKLHVGLFPLLPNAGWVSNISQEVIDRGNAKIFGFIPVILIWSLLILAFLVWFMKYTSFAKKIYAVGGNKECAKLAGIKADKVVLKTYLMSGALLGITSIFFWLPSSQVQPSGTIGMDMTFITIAVVAGVSILGGTGKPIGILFSALLIAMLQRACILWGLGNAYIYTFYGIIVIIAVFATVTKFKKKKVSKNSKMLKEAKGVVQ